MRVDRNQIDILLNFDGEVAQDAMDTRVRGAKDAA